MNRAIIVGLFLVAAASLGSAQTWTDVSTALITAQGITPAYPGGCSGVVADRVNGGVVININGFGLWRSANGSTGWARIDNNTISGRGEAGFAMQVDQNNPKRIAVFSLDGDAGYTPDGTTWKKFTGMGRGWDFGSVDWATPAALVILVEKHEDGGKVYKSVDGGQTWILLNITVPAQTSNDRCMLGVMDATTFVYCSGSGIMRSTDAGNTWAQVSATNARCKVPVLFKGVHYLGSPTGLLKSTDKGATWQVMGAARDIWHGPYFGADENTIVVADKNNLYKTTNAGTVWTKIATAPQTPTATQYDASWFGSFTWDPINNATFCSAMQNPVMRLALPPTSIATKKHAAASRESSGNRYRISLAGDRIVVQGKSSVNARNAGIYAISGKLVVPAGNIR
jgi:photosystem II stability/assembly factor-like uncharacterized protein